MMRKIVFYCMIIGILLVMPLTPSSKNQIVNENALQESSTSMKGFKEAAYTPHAPIVISSDADFVSQGWPGDGGESAPYLIDGLNITSNDICISISDTNAFFKISNCYFAPNDPNAGKGIYFDRAPNGTIVDCEFENFQYGVDADDVVDGNITSNSFRNC
ncbi:MAG: right-handed parallel beta-helix repeat-containing protein, partial [Candidatus Thorarchaeota archaeon]